MDTHFKFIGEWSISEVQKVQEQLGRLYDQLPYDAFCDIHLEALVLGYKYKVWISSIPFSMQFHGWARCLSSAVEQIEEEVMGEVHKWHHRRSVPGPEAQRGYEAVV